MGFPERLLGDDEEIVYDLRPHWWTLAGPVTIGVALVVAASLAAALVPAGHNRQQERLGIVALGLVAVAVVVAPRLLRWLTTHFVVTTDRLIYRRGLIAKSGREIPLERLNDVTFTQSLFERMIGAGDLLIESAGEHGQSSFSHIRNPEAVQLEIYRQMEANGRRMSGAAPVRPPSALDDLERLAGLRDRGVITEAEFQRKKTDLLERM